MITAGEVFEIRDLENLRKVEEFDEERTDVKFVNFVHVFLLSFPQFIHLSVSQSCLSTIY